VKNIRIEAGKIILPSKKTQENLAYAGMTFAYFECTMKRSLPSIQAKCVFRKGIQKVIFVDV